MDENQALDSKIKQWQTIIHTQMHFNDMILRTRAIGASVVLAAYGAAALAVAQYPAREFYLLSTHFHVSVLVIIITLFILLSVFFLDYLYYYKLLLSVVSKGEEIERENTSISDITYPSGEGR